MTEGRRQSGASPEVRKSAVLSDCGAYRYRLARTWDGDLPPALFIGFNPSTADAEQDDPTIRRCVRFAREWGYGGLLMGNLFGYRATEPTVLRSPMEAPMFNPVGEWRREWITRDYCKRENWNDVWLREMAGLAGIVVAAWGSISMPRGWEDRPRQMREVVGPLHVLGLTKGGYPRHPLYMRADARPVPYV